MTDYDSVRSDWWALLNWHLKTNGTRPNGNPREPGDAWTEEEFAHACKVGDPDNPHNGARTVQYWLDKNRKTVTGRCAAIERALFGDNPAYGAWRIDLRITHQKATEAKKKPKTSFSEEALPPSKSVDPVAAAVLTGNRLVVNVRTRVPTHFRGHETLDLIENALNKPQGDLAAVALHGLRGVGKTTLAIAYSHRCWTKCRAVWWIKAETESGMRSDLINLGVRLGWIRADETEELALSTVMDRLTHEGEGILLIYDNALNANSLKHFLPGGGHARIVVTSNNHAWRSVATPIDVKPWLKHVGADFLLARSGRPDTHEAAEALSEALDGLALAHEMAAAYCEQREMSLAQYHRLFQTQPAGFLDDIRYSPSEYGLTVAKTFALAIEAATQNHSAADALISYVAMLAPEPIPIFLFSEGVEEFDESLSSMVAGDALEEAFLALRAFALVQREKIVDEHNTSITTDAIRLHRLVREVVRLRRNIQEQREIYGRLIKMAVGSFRFEIINHPGIWPRLRRLIPIVTPLIERESDIPESSRSEAVKLLFYVSTYQLQVRGSIKEALPLAEEALRRSRNYWGEKDNYTLQTAHHLSVLYRELGRLNEAEAILRPALAISRSVKGERHFLTADLLAGLAIVLNGRGMYKEARELFEAALPLFEKVYDYDHPATIMLAGAFSILLFNMGEWVEAGDLAQWSIGALEERLGPTDPRAIAHRQHLRIVLPLQHEKDAKQQYILRLQHQENVLGKGHPDTIQTLMLIGDQEALDGADSKAMEAYGRALTYAEATYDKDHHLIKRIKELISWLNQ
jgi:tetratricopeptide (TPR) repeat protein